MQIYKFTVEKAYRIDLIYFNFVTENTIIPERIIVFCCNVNFEKV